jgi:mannitol/fructose-specific phosphotransferase system IIA component (Ntr-type)
MRYGEKLREAVMTLQIKAGRYIGQILVDGGLVSCRDLEMALDEQRHTNELLGQVLTRMGIVDPADLKVALSVQEHLVSLEDAVKAAAGVRQMLGAMLLQAGQISEEQLEEAIAEQKEGGKMLGEIFVRRGYLTERQLNALLDFQKGQGDVCSTASPLRLGDILVSSGYLTREQLDSALGKQSVSRKKLGEVLLEEGYVQPQQIKHGITLQQKLLTAILVGILALAAVPDAEAATRSSGTQLKVSATVLPFTKMRVHNQSSVLMITEADISRGYVDVPAGSSIEVSSNSRDGHYLSFECSDEVFKQVRIDGLGKPAVLAGGSSIVPFAMEGKVVQIDLSYRFILSENMKPGAYPWPLTVSVVPL